MRSLTLHEQTAIHGGINYVYDGEIIVGSAIAGAIVTSAFGMMLGGGADAVKTLLPVGAIAGGFLGGSFAIGLELRSYFHPDWS